MLLYKYRSFERFEKVLDILVNERLYCPEYKSLNDPFEGMFYSLIHRNALRGPARFLFKQLSIPRTVDDLPFSDDRKRVASLSATPSDVRMWSLYGGDHAGVAIEIDLDEQTQNLHQVTYRDELIQSGVSLLGPSPDEILKHKTHHWSYECEYRIITNLEFYPIAGRVKRVLVGPRASDTSVQLLERIVGDRIQIVRTKLDIKSLCVVVK